jgi:small subunit ribosomal protein S20
MPSNKSAMKRLRSSEKARIRNKSKKSSLKTMEKKLRSALASSDASSQKLLKDMDSKLDKAAKTGVIHPKTASRKKSRLNRLAASKAVAK